MITVQPATLAMAHDMAPRMRAPDVAEVAALGLTPLDALVNSVNASFVKHSAMKDGRPIAMWGAAGVPGDWGTAMLWMLGTDDVPRHGKAVLRWSRPFVESLLPRFTALRCCVHAEHTQAVRWLQWLKLLPKVEGTINGHTFYLCERTQ